MKEAHCKVLILWPDLAPACEFLVETGSEIEVARPIDVGQQAGLRRLPVEQRLGSLAQHGDVHAYKQP